MLFQMIFNVGAYHLIGIHIRLDNCTDLMNLCNRAVEVCVLMYYL